MRILIADEFNRCRCVRRRWVTSWTLSLHKPLWLLVDARHDLFDILLFAIMLCGVCYWIWSSSTTRWATRWINVLSSTPWSHFFKKTEDTSTRGHTWKLVKKHCHCDSRLYFFSQRVINRWNKLTRGCWRSVHKLFQESTREKTYTADGLL